MSLAIAATVFAVIFTAELPDKTALASLVLGSRYRPTWVFAGVAAALRGARGAGHRGRQPPRPAPPPPA